MRSDTQTGTLVSWWPNRRGGGYRPEQLTMFPSGSLLKGRRRKVQLFVPVRGTPPLPPCAGPRPAPRWRRAASIAPARPRCEL